MAASTHAITVNGVEVTGAVDVISGTQGNTFGTTDLDGYADWNLFYGSATPTYTKDGGSILTNFAEGNQALTNAASSRRYDFSWSDGTAPDVTGTAADNVGFKGVQNGTLGTFLSWDVVLPELTGDVTGYTMTYYTNEKRLDSSVRVSGNATDYTSIVSRTGNDENNTRIWTVTMSGYTGTQTLNFEHYLDDENGNGTNDTVLYFGNVMVSAVPEPSAYAMLAGLLAMTAVMLRRRG